MERITGFDRIFTDGRLTLGVFAPIEAYRGSLPTMQNHLMLAQRAEKLNFAAIWLRDVPLYDPSFGDAGQIYDPWVYLGYLAASTTRIALATGSIVLPLRHPLHVAKAAASIDQLSDGRLVLGVASGDRPVEFPAFGLNGEQRGERFRDSLSFLRRALAEHFPEIVSPLGSLQGTDLLPKPTNGRLPILITGSSRQSIDWIAAHGDGWVTYPRPLAAQAELVAQWRRLTSDGAPGQFKPFAQSLYLDLSEHRETAPTPIHLGVRLGRDPLIQLLRGLETSGVNHVVLNFKYGRRPAFEVMEELGAEVLPLFPPRTSAKSIQDPSLSEPVPTHCI